ncbi:MAG TPA: DUF58 domain-containing protein [Candidatus Omnitrophota bacterium]|jgi:uncharacterized protein (DUF58 family)|nr:MAG: hypothetical protein BWY49_00869 [Candidatus Omnitrophica bacterium ADurb.Bin314]HOE69429.1 DUF58 domain-containing protein [Candidatus Omnitrophota bacterium]HQB94299.1 DUF58 domain-containing protein [Candidatus Omnitrophota bacterium]
MIPAALLKKVRRIEIRTTRLVNDLFGGEYESVFKGQGIEFADVREYVPGDDIRTIDWNVTARSAHPFVKKFVETRELTVFFVVDMSGSQHFGTSGKLKSEIAAEIAAILAFSAVKNNDKTGLLICTDRVEKFLPVKKGRNHALRVIREILGYQPQSRGTKLESAIQYIHNVLTRSAVVFLISDFQDEGYEKALKILSQKHDVVAIHLKDRLERSFPGVGLVELRDRETGETTLIDSSSRTFRKRFEENTRAREESTSKLFRKLQIDRVEVPAEASYIDPLIKFFKSRERKRK